MRVLARAGGGNATKVECNGPNSQQNMADVRADASPIPARFCDTSPATIAAQIYYGKGLSSKELYDQLYETCNFPTDPDVTPNSPNYDFEISMECELLLRKQSEQVGPHNVCEWSSTHSNHG